MAKRKDDDKRFEDLGKGRVVDKDKKTVFSPNTIDKMKEISDKSRGKSGTNKDDEDDE